MHMPDMPLHDPFILAHEPTKTYYLYTTNSPRVSGDRSVGTMAYTSRDLKNWDRPKVVFKIPQGTWADPTTRPWAPEVHAYKGKFYLFTTLHNNKKVYVAPPAVWYPQTARSTVIAESDSPAGPFKLMSNGGPWTPPEFMTLDGTLFVDQADKPWMVYAHEWVQKLDGTMEAIPLTDDLSAAAGDPIHLFRASEAPWVKTEKPRPTTKPTVYVTDGCQFYRTKDGKLLMLWSSYDQLLKAPNRDAGSYVQTVARSTTGDLAGPWEQLQPLVHQDSGHGMLFRTFEGQLMLVLHRPFHNARGKLYEVEDTGDNLKVVRQRTDLDGGDPPVTQPASR
jgi:beta-xylosidase